jgi:hypothetical protein
VTCVLGCVNDSSAECVAAIRAQLQAAGALAQTVVVAAEPGAPLGERYAALCTACSIGERVRDEGGHALVVLDDLHPLVQVRACVRVWGGGGAHAARWGTCCRWADAASGWPAAGRDGLRRRGQRARETGSAAATRPCQAAALRLPAGVMAAPPLPPPGSTPAPPAPPAPGRRCGTRS